ncbi:MAG: 16S rRNA (cytosine(967)-C(5))-methyltransferase RsmB [Firmicutes bacterium]|nr:16S rRNA (cytosine(967)-C(5))-methyltransferase RsmB [Bacillota bacterium]
MININPREIAASALFEILEKGGYNNVVLKRSLSANGAMPAEDRGFVTDCVNGTLRNVIYIDYVLEKVSGVKVKKMKPYIRTVLRMSLYQLEFMKKSPYAVVDEAVKLVKKRKMGGLAPFVNGVLRNVLRTPDAFDVNENTNAKRLSILYSHPEWVVKSWIKAYGVKFTEDLCGADNTPPEVTAVVNTLLCDKETLEKEFSAQGIMAEESRFFPIIIKLSGTADISRLDSFRKGHFHIMDEASAAAVFALDPQPEERILDVCAAPGGKSILIAELMGNKGEVVSRDISLLKLEMLEDTADRLKLDIIRTEEKDASVLCEEDVSAFDRVLVDAPCSGLGLLRKKPDIRLKKTKDDIGALVEIQRKILETASKYVKPGGRLLYSTCTLTKEENRENFLWFLEKNPGFEDIDLNEVLPEAMCGKSGKYGYAELYPNVQGTDGFFVSAARRKSDD